MKKQKFKRTAFKRAINIKRTKEEISIAAAAAAAKVARTSMERADSTGATSMDNFAVICNWLNEPVSKFF